MSEVLSTANKTTLEGKSMHLLRTPYIRFHAIIILIAVAFSFPAFAENNAKVGVHVKIENFGKISDSYYRGAQPKGNDYADLAGFGVKAVINLTSDDADQSEPGLVEKVGMKYFQIPMTTHESPSVTKIAQFLKIVLDPGNQPVYVHCVGGKHRTGVMTAVYRMTQNSWTADQAFDEMKKFKFGATFLHPEFKNFVYDFDTKLTKEPSMRTEIATAAVAVP
jgi:protein-tyrosine phosphatase